MIHQPMHWRSLFLSDIHLGTRACRAPELLEFIRRNDAETIYLVGDLVDFWRMRRANWSQEHNDVIQKLLRKARKGTRIIVVPGNHDEAFDAYCGLTFGNVEIRSEAVHQTADGVRLIVMHGDEFDGVVHYARWFAALGDASYVAAIAANGIVNRVRQYIGLGHWSLAVYMKRNIKQAVAFIDRFERALASAAQRRGFDGVVCGHIHHAADKTIDGVRYLNCGDWVEGCTALAEDHDGRFHLLRWHGDQGAPIAPGGVEWRAWVDGNAVVSCT